MSSESSSSSLPQFDTTHYCSQIFWLIVCFVLLTMFLKKIIIPRVNKILEKRMSYIDTMNEENNIAIASNKEIELRIDDVKKSKQEKINNIISEANECASSTITNKIQMIDNATSENFKVYSHKLYEDIRNIEHFTKNTIGDLANTIVYKIKNQW